MSDTIAGLLQQHAHDPDRTFLLLLDPHNAVETTVTYAEQHARSTRVAQALNARRLQPGDRVLVNLPNGRAFFDIWFACALAGLVFVPVNPQSSADDLDHIRGDVRPALEITSPDQVDELRKLKAPIADQPTPRDGLAAILYTSGTTSRAKGVMVTEANYLTVGGAVSEHLTVSETDRWLVTLPLFHANAQYYCTMSALSAGASLAVASRFSASGWGAQARAAQATLASLFAAPIRMILKHPENPHDARNHLRAVVFAQNLAARDASGFQARFGTRLLQLYGMTETVIPPTMNPTTGGRHDSIGRPLPGVEIDLVDGEGHVTDAPAGEMRVKGTQGTTFAAGYWRNPTATAETFTDTGLRTGDLARRDADGFYYFVDRAKDMIKRAGENVAASDVERVVTAHPEVAECAVVGIPDPIRDEGILLVVVTRAGHSPTAEKLIDWCRDRLSSFKVPTDVTFVQELPRTSIGKVRKVDLRAAHLAGHPQRYATNQPPTGET